MEIDYGVSDKDKMRSATLRYWFNFHKHLSVIYLFEKLFIDSTIEHLHF